jgi:cell division protein ZapA (FtsZ GTPase activity inhibitor)
MSNTETIEFSALGARLRLAGGDNPKLIREISQFVQERVAELSESAPNAQPLQLALLTALNIAEQLFKEREHGRAECDQAVTKVRVLLESLG